MGGSLPVAFPPPGQYGDICPVVKSIPSETNRGKYNYIILSKWRQPEHGERFGATTLRQKVSICLRVRWKMSFSSLSTKKLKAKIEANSNQGLNSRSFSLGHTQIPHSPQGLPSTLYGAAPLATPDVWGSQREVSL